MISREGSKLVAIVRARLSVCDDEELRMAGNDLCDIFEELSAAFELGSSLIDSMLSNKK